MTAVDTWAARVKNPAWKAILAVVLARSALYDRDVRRVKDALAGVGLGMAIGEFARGLLDLAEHGALSNEAGTFLQGTIDPAVEPRRRSLGHQLLAEVALFTSEHASALQHLELAVDAGLADILWLDRCPLFDPVRSEPRFRAVRTRTGAAAREIVDAFRAG